MASGPRLEGESELVYKRRLKREAAEEKRQKRVKAALPEGVVTIEERIGQIHAQMEEAINDGDWEQSILVLISYTVHIETRLADVENKMVNLLASLKMAAELEQKNKSGLVTPDGTPIVS